MWVSFLRDQCEHFGNTTNNRLECSHSKLKDLMCRSSSLTEMFDGVITFINFINHESTHNASTSTALDDISGVREMSSTCTGYATQLVLKQMEVAQKVEYQHTYTDASGGVIVSYGQSSYDVDNNASSCSCSFWKTMSLPCRHILHVRLNVNQTIFEECMFHPRWFKSYQVDFPSDSSCNSLSSSEVNNNVDSHLNYDLLCEPPMTTCTLSQSHKYSQTLAVHASMVGMPQFRQMFGLVSSLINHWEAGIECTLVPYNDENGTSGVLSKSQDSDKMVVVEKEANCDVTVSSNMNTNFEVHKTETQCMSHTILDEEVISSDTDEASIQPKPDGLAT